MSFMDLLEPSKPPTALLLRRREVSMLTDDDLDALVRKHGATSYRNRADTQNPAYGFTPAGLLNLLAEVTREIRKQDEALIRQLVEALEVTASDVCQVAHHKKRDQHGSGDVCPVQARHDEAIAAGRARLEGRP